MSREPPAVAGRAVCAADVREDVGSQEAPRPPDLLARQRARLGESEHRLRADAQERSASSAVRTSCSSVIFPHSPATDRIFTLVRARASWRQVVLLASRELFGRASDRRL